MTLALGSLAAWLSSSTCTVSLLVFQPFSDGESVQVPKVPS